MAARRLAFALSILLISGCGSSSRIPLSGAVTYEGAPVPYGEIVFAPDTEKGNDGPGAVAPIRDGKYQTIPEQGIAGGPHVVRISGFDGPPTVKPGESQPTSKVIFENVEIRVDLPRQKGTYDFAVPKAEPKKPVERPRAHG